MNATDNGSEDVRAGTCCPHCQASLEPPPEPHPPWCLVGDLFARLGAKDIEVERLREFVRAIANDDFVSMVAIGGPVEHRGSTSRFAEDFELEGSYQADARYVHPVRDKARKRAARALLDDREDHQ